MDTLVVLAFALLVLGVLGSILPLLPGGVLSLAGVLLYWWHTGAPGPLLLALLVLTGLFAVAVDWLAGYIGARASGVDTRTSLVAGAVGFLAMFFGGPFGLLAGVAATVFLLDVRRTGDVDASLRRAAGATLGVLVSAVVQVALTLGMLVAMLWVQFW